MRFLVFFFQLGGGYLFGLPVGFVADSIGATIGAGAAFLLGRTVSLWTLKYVSQFYTSKLIYMSTMKIFCFSNHYLLMIAIDCCLTSILHSSFPSMFSLSVSKLGVRRVEAVASRRVFKGVASASWRLKLGRLEALPGGQHPNSRNPKTSLY